MTILPTGSTHPFDADTAVTDVGNATYTASITDRWNALTGTPNGGYLLAICLQALWQTLPFPDPLVVSAHFLRRAEVGRAQVGTEIARSGRRIAIGEARLSQNGDEVVRVVAGFADLQKASGRTLVLGEAPVLPSPPDAIDPMGG